MVVKARNGFDFVMQDKGRFQIRVVVGCFLSPPRFRWETSRGRRSYYVSKEALPESMRIGNFLLPTDEKAELS